MKRVRLSPWTLLPALCLVSGSALAGNFTPAPAEIFGGEATETCAWPSEVSLGSCSATLIHPQVIIYAAHCGEGYNSVRFGETANSPGRIEGIQFCKTNPGYGNAPGTDYAYCVLSEPVFDVPIIPPVMGCEVDELLVPGAEVVLVGHGEADAGPGYGQKREAWTTLVQIRNNEALLGGDGIDPCSGDSGGPAFIRAKDGSWRAFGIVSYGPIPCGGGSWYSMMHRAMPWIEGELAQYGVDLTPCHDADGAWNPSEACQGFPFDSHQSLGAWPDTCGMGGEVSGPSTACGPAFDAPDDGDLPSAVITMPVTMTRYDTMGESVVSVPVEVEATDPGDGVAAVHLMINGNEFEGGVDKLPPYAWNLDFPPGGYTLQARVVDFHGNEAVSDYVVFGVDQDAPEPPPPPEPPAPEEEGGTGDETGTEPSVDDGGGKGCGCNSSSEGGSWGAGLLLFGLAAVRRRRRRVV